MGKYITQVAYDIFSHVKMDDEHSVTLIVIVRAVNKANSTEQALCTWSALP